MKKLSNLLTNDEILYELILSTNLPFKLEVYSDIHSKFYTNKVSILRLMDKFIITNDGICEPFNDEYLPIEIVITMFNIAVDHEVQELYRKISVLKNIQSESKISRHGKTIAHFLNLNHLDIKEVGGNHLIYVNSLYCNGCESLDEYSKKCSNLDRFIKESGINRDAKIYLMKPEAYKKYVEHGRKLDDEKIWI